MTRWKTIFFNITFTLNCLLLFLLLLNDKIVVPAWLQVGGRMHPLLLHFPIAMIVLYVLWILFAVGNSHYKQIASDLLLLSSFTSVITALCGLLLSREPGYDPDALQTHKWAGCIVAFLLLFWYWISSAKNVSRWFNISASFVMLVTIMVAGDLGAAITHGENFLMAPVTPEKERKTVLFEEAFVYADVVQPVLEAKCLSCHNSKKAKGQLVMETAGLLLKGGKDGKLWDTAQADLGLLMRRIHLPEDEKEHMPPSGKPQLTDEEVVILERWIKGGADMNKKVIELAASDTLRTLAYKRLKAFSEEKYDFAAADEKTIKKLNNTNRVIYPVATKSPALVVNFYNSPYFNSKQLSELSDIGQQVVELNLSKMPVKDDDLKTIAGFSNLRILNLNYSSITGTSLDQLKKLPLLKHLSLTGTAVTAKQLAVLQEFPKLRSVFIWNTGITPAALASINKQGKIRFETGFDAAKVVMKLTPPIVVNGDSIVTKPVAVQLKHYVPGTTIRYTTDGTDPDSTSSPIFKNDVQVQKIFELKARAVKPGWYSSDVVSRYFFTSHYVPDSVLLLQPADAKYRAKEAKTLADLVKSEPSKGTGKWLGFQNNAFEGLLMFKSPVTITSVTLSMLRDLGASIFPPTEVEVYGGIDKNQLHLLNKIIPKQAVKGDPTVNLPIGGEFSPVEVKFIKVIAKPLTKIPEWHNEKGKKAWVFIDEVMVN
jgi:uncharacterized membrane protein